MVERAVVARYDTSCNGRGKFGRQDAQRGRHRMKPAVARIVMLSAKSV
jgi:hypothetical protein